VDKKRIQPKSSKTKRAFQASASEKEWLVALEREHRCSTALFEQVVRDAWHSFFSYRATLQCRDPRQSPSVAVSVVARLLKIHKDLLCNVAGDGGHLYELICRLGLERVYPNEFKTDLCGRQVTAAMLPAEPGPCHQLNKSIRVQRIWTRVEKKALKQEAKALVKELEEDETLRIGSARFRKKLAAAIERVHSRPLKKAPWELQLDCGVILPGLGLLEIKASGTIGGQKVQQMVERHITRALALGDPDIDLRFGIFYRNQGEREPNTALKKYATVGSGLLIQEELYARLFPGVPAKLVIARLEEIGLEVGAEYVPLLLGQHLRAA
jgi:hypothetical protein